MSINPGTPLTIGVPLVLAGAVFPVPTGAVVTAQIFTPDQVQSLSSQITPNPQAIGADWTQGLIVCEFSATDTFQCTPPLVVIVVGVTINGDTRYFHRVVNVNEGAPLQSIFSMVDVQELKTDRLMLISRQYFPRVALSDAYLFRKLLAAEALTARELRTFLKVTQILPPNHQCERDTYLRQGIPVYDEPGYDYDPEFFQGNTWGYLQLRQRPALQVQELCLNYPDQYQAIFTFPNDWIRLDKKYGRLNLVPTQHVASIALDGYIMSAIGGGSVIPLMMACKYTAGLTDARRDYPDLIDVIFKRTALSIIEDKFMPASGSVSVDGLSQSLSFQAKDYAERISGIITTIRGSIGGPSLQVM